MRSLLVTIVFVAACGDNNNNNVDAAGKTFLDAKPIDAAVDAGPSTVTLNGGANDLLWDATTSSLYLTDDNANTLDKWTDLYGTVTLATLPTVTGPNPGGLVKTADGSIFTVNFGDGMTTGALWSVTPDNVSHAYTGLDGSYKYLDLEQGADGTWYLAGFKGNSTSPVGRIWTLAIDTTAHTVVPTEILGPETATMEVLKKLVGMVVTPDAIYASDQTSHTIIKIELPAKTLDATPFATGLSVGDFLFQMPNGDLLTGGGTAINRISHTDGTVSVVDPDGQTFVKIHGLAYDAVKKRLFAIDHQSSTAPDTLHIIPLAQ